MEWYLEGSEARRHTQLQSTQPVSIDPRRAVRRVHPLDARNYPIPMPAGALYEAPQGISPDGTRVVGTFVDGVSSQKRCFQWHPGDAAVVDLGLPPGQQGCEGFAVNDAGEIVGQLE